MKWEVASENGASVLVRDNFLRAIAIEADSLKEADQSQQ